MAALVPGVVVREMCGSTVEQYGFRNPGNQRLRARCATTRRARGHLDAR
ncbi:hypothetical protein [Streptomyces olivochromogenes]|nr:hypothetical protein [Streptomyces olivochromogenes]